MAVTLVLYVLIFGPTCWLNGSTTNARILPNIYMPVGWAMSRFPEIKLVVSCFGGIGMDSKAAVLIPAGYHSDGRRILEPIWGLR